MLIAQHPPILAADSAPTSCQYPLPTPIGAAETSPSSAPTSQGEGLSQQAELVGVQAALGRHGIHLAAQSLHLLHQHFL